jgi:hypothetical protein
VRDFIESLVRIDPVTRLGVDPETHRFSPKTIRSHRLFEGFDWSVLEAQVAGFTLADPGDFFSASSEATVPSSGAPSLENHYHQQPIHSDEYAKYVFSVSDDSNPFDKWAETINDAKPSTGSTSAAQDDSSDDNESSGRKTPVSNHDDEFSDDEEDVVDDVGVMAVRGAHPDFSA